MQEAVIDEGLNEGLNEGLKSQSDMKNDALDDALGLRIIEILRGTPSISQEVLASELNVTRRTIQRKMDELKERKQIERKGGKRFGYWEIHLPEKN